MLLKMAILSLVSLQTLHATIEYAIDERSPLPVAFSRQSHNRISVEEGSIRKVFGDQAVFSITIDEGIGQAFVSLLHEIGEQPAILTVVMSSGVVQDLLITSEQKVAEHLILKEKAEEIDEFPQFSQDFHALTITFLNQILSGKVPLGYGKREIQMGDKLSLPKPLEAIPLSVLEGPYETIVLYTIRNKGRKSVVINTDAIKRPGDNWVFLNAQELDFTETTSCIISTPKD